MGSATGAVRILLRLEGLSVLLLCLLLYAKLGAGWHAFFLLFLIPDLSLIAYTAGIKFGSIAYNAAHSYCGALTCIVIGILLPSPGALSAGIIWCAHIGFDRALGYGLKYPTNFRDTHLGTIGRRTVTADK